MLGVIIGDIAGSRFETIRAPLIKSTEFELFNGKCHVTDDSVMTSAVAEALLTPAATDAELESSVIRRMQAWGRKYPKAWYGKKFREWLKEEEPRPYGSFGNGSAMRVAPVGWMYDSLERVEEVADITSRVSHDHPESIRAAQAVAGAVFLARRHADKAAIRRYCEEKHGYDLSRTPDEIRPAYRFSSRAQTSVPEALCCFLHSASFENAVRLAVSLGGDTDTQAAIAGAVAEAFYSAACGHDCIPPEMREAAFRFMPEDMRMIAVRFRTGVQGYPAKTTG